jgi:hypothetical protein
MPTPPIPSRRRATRKPLVYALLRRWNEPALAGIDYFEYEHLKSLGYGRWLRRGRLTAEMIADLLFHELDCRRYFAANIALGGSEERDRIAVIIRGRGDAITDEERACLETIESLQRRSAKRRPQAITAYTDEDEAVYVPEHPDTWREWNTIRTTYRSVIDEALTLLFDSIESNELRRLGEGPRSPRFHLGERARELSYANQLGRELGPGFLDPNASSSHRAACVRKWKQLALAAPPPAAPTHTRHHPRTRPLTIQARRLRQADRGIERELAELRVLRAAAELQRNDPRRIAYEERFHVLAVKRVRRAEFRERQFLEIRAQERAELGLAS